MRATPLLDSARPARAAYGTRHFGPALFSLEILLEAAHPTVFAAFKVSRGLAWVALSSVFLASCIAIYSKTSPVRVLSVRTVHIKLRNLACSGFRNKCLPLS